MPSNIKTEFTRFFKNPRKYLYCLVLLWIHPYRFSVKETLKIYPYDPESNIRAQELIRKIKKLCPKLDLYLIGSIGMQIEGRGDIDLYAVTPSALLSETFSKIISVFGKPVKRGKTFGEWKFRYKGSPAELHVANPEDKDFNNQILLFNLLKNNPDYLIEYRNLKIELNNHPIREYVRRRMVFFNRILLAANH